MISGTNSNQSDQDNCHYKSFKFDAAAATSTTNGDEQYLKSNDSYDSECSGSPMSLVSDRPQGQDIRESSGIEKPFLDNQSGKQPRHKDSNQSLSKVAKVETDILCPHTCENVTSWTPFLSRNCEESVIWSKISTSDQAWSWQLYFIQARTVTQHFKSKYLSQCYFSLVSSLVFEKDVPVNLPKHFK